MANPTWPAGLPQDVLVGYAEDLPGVTLRSQMDAGPAKVRRRYTANVRPFAVSIELERRPADPPNDQVKIFRTFFNDDLKGGSLPFDWVDPLDDSAVTFRFVVGGDKPPPKIRHLVGNLYRVDLQLEVLP